MDKPLTTIGWREWLSLPALGIPQIKAKIDTGAKTSALHTFSLQTYTEQGCKWVRFGLHPFQKKLKPELFCNAEVIDERVVSDSGGHREQRLVIVTPVRLGTQQWPVEITLTNRENMIFRMLLGRTAMQGRFLVNPQASYQAGKPIKD